jgi:hypothetical protein
MFTTEEWHISSSNLIWMDRMQFKGLELEILLAMAAQPILLVLVIFCAEEGMHILK